MLRSSPELRADSTIDSEDGATSRSVVLRLLGLTDDPRMLGRIGSCTKLLESLAEVAWGLSSRHSMEP